LQCAQPIALLTNVSEASKQVETQRQIQLKRAEVVLNKLPAYDSRSIAKVSELNYYCMTNARIDAENSFNDKTIGDSGIL
jgi:hypothetical protein